MQGGVPTLADMIREALDAYISKNVKASDNLELHIEDDQ